MISQVTIGMKHQEGDRSAGARGSAWGWPRAEGQAAGPTGGRLQARLRPSGAGGRCSRPGGRQRPRCWRLVRGTLSGISVTRGLRARAETTGRGVSQQEARSGPFCEARPGHEAERGRSCWKWGPGAREGRGAAGAPSSRRRWAGRCGRGREEARPRLPRRAGPGCPRWDSGAERVGRGPHHCRLQVTKTTTRHRGKAHFPWSLQQGVHRQP